MNKLFFLAVLIALSSCTPVPNRMFKTPKDYVFANDSVSPPQGPYIIQAEDRIDLHIFSNDGFKLVDITMTNMSQNANSEGIEYIVEQNGEVKMPVIGRVVLKGLNIKEAETLLEEKYSKYYMEPFVILRVVSRQAFVFHNDGGKGTVIRLMNDHTTLYEALALAGGLSEYSKSYKIRILRGDIKNPKVYQADLSNIEALKNSELQVYPNDLIYVESGSGFTRRLSTEFLPYLSLLTSILVLMTYFKQ